MEGKDMRLRDWMNRNGMKQDQFARETGIGQSTLSQFCTGARRPSLKMMGRIAAATRGEVTPNDWLRDLEFGEGSERKAA
jgi:transcriptional regulator with XRE-family HTH domain